MIKAKVRYTEKHYKQLVNHTPLLIQKIISYIFVSVICIVFLLLILGKLCGGEYSLIPIFIPFALGLFSIIYMAMIPKIMVKRHFQQFPDSEEYYTFGEDGFTELTKGPGLNHEQSVNYDRFISCYENREWFLLFITRNTAYIIHKSEITSGTPDELRELLKTRLGNKFHARKEGTS